MDEAKYWRVYYKIQGLLAKEFIGNYGENSSGGVRKLSTLSPKLNKDAEDIAKTICRMQRE